MPLNPQVEALLTMFAAMPAWDYATLTAPEYYRVVGDPTRGLTCLVARVKLINGGDAL